jgi:polyisoprenyl-teichoic acid--peptidoglycan teichoic acid transferase
VPAALVAVVATASCTAARSGRAPDAPPEAPSATGAESAPRPDLSFRLVQVSASAVDKGRVPPKDLAEPAQAVRRSIEGLYRAAFVEPDVEAWQEGDYTELFFHLSAPARERALSDLGILTLGPAAAEVDVVDPTRAIVRLRFLFDRHERPVVALADTEFDATALAGETRSPITHRAEYTLKRLNGAWRVVSYDVRARVPRPEQDRVETGQAAFAPGVPGSDPRFVLVIGSDARPRQSMLRTRADSIHIVAVEPQSGRVSLLGIPRDSWVPIPGWGTDKINAALVRGGPELLVDTVERLSGIRIDAYVLTGFHGFTMMVNAIGGIQVDIPYPIQDALAKAWFKKGTRRLNGAAALAFSRARHDVPGGDFGRSLNQGRVLAAALATLREQANGGAAALLPWVIAGANHVHTDLGLDEMFGLALAATAYLPGPVRNAVVGGHGGTIGGKSVVILDARAHATFRDLARDGVLGS